MNEKRGNWYLLTGLVLGLVIGLGFAWFISPVKYTDIAPASLTSSYKDEYRRVIALAYTANHDIDRARVRINLLDANNPAQVLAAQAQHMVAENQAPQEARALALLAADLGRPQSISAATLAPQTTSETTTQAAPGEENTAVPEETDLPTVEVEAAIQTPTLPRPTRTPTITLTPVPTFTPRPTATPMPVLDAPFTLKTKNEICNGTIQPGLLQIEVVDSQGNPYAGVQIVITWQDGEDSFYTGLSPEISSGYADFVMAQGERYRLRVGQVSSTINDLQWRENCALKMEFAEE